MASLGGCQDLSRMPGDAQSTPAPVAPSPYRRCLRSCRPGMVPACCGGAIIGGFRWHGKSKRRSVASRGKGQSSNLADTLKEACRSLDLLPDVLWMQEILGSNPCAPTISPSPPLAANMRRNLNTMLMAGSSFFYVSFMPYHLRSDAEGQARLHALSNRGEYQVCAFSSFCWG